MGVRVPPRAPSVAELRVRLTPRARRDEITKIEGDLVHARVSAPPVDGRANTALCRLVAAALGVPPSRVSVVRGQTARVKVVRVEGLDGDEALTRIAPDPGASSRGG
jgi:uncharacterized protein